MSDRRATAVAIGLLLFGACGGGGGGGARTPTQPTPGITYRPSGGADANAVALTQAAGTNATTLRLDLRALEVEDLYGVALDVVFPTSVFEFALVIEGAHLAGTTTSLQFEEVSPGRVVIGLSRLGPSGGVSGTGTLATLELAARGVGGTGSIAIENARAFDAGAEQIAGVEFRGGTVTVVP